MAKRTMRSMADSRLELAEIVGEEGRQGQRMQAGGLLSQMDLVAARVAMRHAHSPVATLLFDRVELTRPVLHQDLVRMQGHLVAVGHSSMVVEVVGQRMDALGQAFSPLLHSFITMVAVDEAGQPNRDIPGLAYAGPEEEAVGQEVARRREEAAQWQALQDDVDRQGPLTASMVNESLNQDKQAFLSAAETEIRVRQQFLPRHVNIMGTIFGGEILQVMDRVAIYTARHFTRNRNMVTLAMNRILFRQPIFTTDLVEITARVVYVRRYTLEVELQVNVQKPNGETLHSHSGYFTVLNYDEAGFKRPIHTGLALEDRDQETLQRFLKAKIRHQFWENHRQTT